jgi:DNA-binding GntR family transcriptional regulator
VQHFVARATPADLQALAACIEAEEAARLVGDTAMALRQSGHFHLLLADATGHHTFAAFLRKLVSRTSLILMSHGRDRVAGLQPGLLDVAKGAAAPRRWVQACRCDEHRGLLTALKTAVKARGGQASVPVQQAVALMTDHLLLIESGLRLGEPGDAGTLALPT